MLSPPVEQAFPTPRAPLSQILPDFPSFSTILTHAWRNFTNRMRLCRYQPSWILSDFQPINNVFIFSLKKHLRPQGTQISLQQEFINWIIIKWSPSETHAHLQINSTIKQTCEIIGRLSYVNISLNWNKWECNKRFSRLPATQLYAKQNGRQKWEKKAAYGRANLIKQYSFDEIMHS